MVNFHSIFTQQGYWYQTINANSDPEFMKYKSELNIVKDGTWLYSTDVNYISINETVQF